MPHFKFSIRRDSIVALRWTTCTLCRCHVEMILFRTALMSRLTKCYIQLCFCFIHKRDVHMWKWTTSVCGKNVRGQGIGLAKLHSLGNSPPSHLGGKFQTAKACDIVSHCSQSLWIHCISHCVLDRVRPHKLLQSIWGKFTVKSV